MAAQHLTVRGLPGDPRRSAEAKSYERPQYNPENTPPDGTLLVSLFFGIAGVLMKVRAPSRLLEDEACV
jgi:hypothetical protein